MVVEKAANGAAVIETLQRQIPGVIAQVPAGSKEQRAASVVPTVESGACYLPEGAAWVDDLVEEFASFPGKHDDVVDCAEIGLRRLSERHATVSDAAHAALMEMNDSLACDSFVSGLE